MIRREPVDEPCYLGKDCPGSNCPYNMTRSRSPSGTVYITVPAVPHQIQMPGSVVYAKRPSSYSPPVVHHPEYYPCAPRKQMVTTSTQTTPELLESYLSIKKEPVDPEVASCHAFSCKCQEDVRPKIVMFRDGKAVSVSM